MHNKHLGSSFDDFLQEEKLLADAEAVALKRVIAFQIAQEMERSNLTKTEMARRMKTSVEREEALTSLFKQVTNISKRFIHQES